MREGVFTFSPLPVLSTKAAFPPFASMYVNVCVGIFFVENKNYETENVEQRLRFEGKEEEEVIIFEFWCTAHLGGGS